MRQVVVYALYAWCLISLVMLVLYLVRRGKPADEGAAAGLNAGADGPELLSTDPAEQLSVKNEPVGTEKTEPVPSTRTAQPEPDTVEVPALSSISAAAAGGASAAMDTAATDSSERVALPPTDVPPTDVPPTDVPLTDAPVSSATPMAASTAPKTLSDLLVGFQLPHDLLPVIPDHDDITERHVSLMTSSAPVDVVGPAVADELERLGFELTPLSENELLAVRGDDRLALTLVTSPTTAEQGGRLLYPQANPGDVVVTIEVTDKTL